MAQPQGWEYESSVVLSSNEDRYAELRRRGNIGWEAWHMEILPDGRREIYFKRPKW